MCEQEVKKHLKAFIQAYESWKKVSREAKCVWKDKTIQYQTTQGGYDYVNQTYEVLQCNSLKTLDIVQCL